MGQKKHSKGEDSSSSSSQSEGRCASLLQSTSSEIDRTDDLVYKYTTRVVSAVRQLLQGVQEARTRDYLQLVKTVGQELRGLLSTVDELMDTLPAAHHREVTLVHQVLSKDMAALVKALKMATEMQETTVEAEYRRAMLQAAHVLVVHAKNLLDTVDALRIRLAQPQTLVRMKENMLYANLPPPPLNSTNHVN